MFILLNYIGEQNHYVIDHETELDSCVFYYMQGSRLTPRNALIVGLLNSLMTEDLFNTLRTQETLGKTNQRSILQ